MPDAGKLTRDELDEWRSHPVTEWLLAVLRKGAAENKASLQSSLWETGSCNPETMGRVKAQGELIEDLEEATEDDWNEWADHYKQKRD